MSLSAHDKKTTFLHCALFFMYIPSKDAPPVAYDSLHFDDHHTPGDQTTLRKDRVSTAKGSHQKNSRGKVLSRASECPFFFDHRM